MKSFILGLVTTIVALGIGSLEYVRLGLAEVQADVNPPAWEHQLAQFALNASVRRSTATLRNPLLPTDANLVTGGKLYLKTCAGCHGKPGRSRNAPGYPAPPQFFQSGTQHSEPELFWVVKHGIRNTGMSAYGIFYSDETIWTLAVFLKRMDHLSPAVLADIQVKDH